MIPAFDLGQVLPPFTGGDEVGAVHPRSPYQATLLELVERFATSPERGVVLRGLLDFRAALRNAGFVTGFQWIDGSFVEDCEKVRGRPPGDVDVVSLLRRPEPHAAENDWQAFVAANAATIFNHDQIKADLHCDSFFIDLDIDPTAVAQQCAYWFGLFSHQRSSFRWKGMVQVNFICDDAEAEAELAARELQW